MRCTLLLATALSCSLAACAGGGDEPAAEPDEPSSTSAPAGVAGTAPGTELSFGEPATLVWKPTASVTGALELTVESVAEQRQSVFDGWVRDDAMAASRPYFVEVSLTNVGDSDLGGQVVPLWLRDDTGVLGAPWTLGGDFTACQSGPLPDDFAPDEEAEMCLVYLAPDGARIEDMVFEPTEGYDPISWTGEVDEPARKKPARDDRRKRRRG